MAVNMNIRWSGNSKKSEFQTVFFIITLVLLACLSTGSSEFNKKGKAYQKINAERWFVDYTNIDILLHVDTGGVILNKQPRKQAVTGFMTFNWFESRFYIKLTKDDIIGGGANIVVDGKKEEIFSNTLGDIQIYRGTVQQPCCNNRVIVKVTTEGVDAIINTENDTFFIEPASRFEHAILKYNFERNTSTRHYPSLIYKRSDVKDTIYNSTGFFSDIMTLNHTSDASRSTHERQKRSIDRTECTLHIVADHTFYNEVGHSSTVNTISEMSYLVSEADIIFRGTDFDGDGIGDNIGFYVTNISIYTTPYGYKMANTPEVMSYLTAFTKYDFGDYCLAIAFSSRQFEDGVIGLAYVASSSAYGSPGGICQKRILYGSEEVSLNTCLITTTSGGRLPVYKSVLTLTHEFGHSFGSPHDGGERTHCEPDSEYGSFLMDPYTTDGSKPNNYIFSACSISYMFPVVKNKASCFKETIEAVCGNGLHEQGEECDCGRNDECPDVDPCCTPSDVSLSDPDTPCTLRTSVGSECSPKVTVCCTDSCKVEPLMSNKLCRKTSDCVLSATCDGVSPECPNKTLEADNSMCNNGLKTCKGGFCIGSICAANNLVTCSCSGIYACYVCCLTNSSECMPSKNANLEYIKRATGESCNNMNGYCNDHGECVLQGQKGTLDRLNQVFTREGIDSAKAWVKTYWYYILTGGLGLVFLIIMFVTTCRGDKDVHTKAFMFGQFSKIQREAELQKINIEKRKQDTNTYYEKKIENLDKQDNTMILTDALSRMILFFPTVPRHVLIQTLKSSANEDAAVKLLLIRNFPFRRICNVPHNKGMADFKLA